MTQRLTSLVKELSLGVLVGVGCGLGAAVFLTLLEAATSFRTSHTQVVFALPLAGLVMGLVLERFGAPVILGTSLVIDRTREGGDPIPARVGPMVLLGTVLTHLFGGSAGREGTAVQLGAGVAERVSVWARVDPSLRRQLLVAGVAGGFGAVFGTPWAGVFFGLELFALRRLEWRAIGVATIAPLVGDFVVRRLGVTHAAYPQVASVGPSLLLLAKWALVAAAFALTTVVFVEALERLKKGSARLVPQLRWRLTLGGIVVVGLWHWTGSDDFLGLGMPTIARAFVDPSMPEVTFLWKLVFTVATVGLGYLGGEVTPLFFIGATLGNVLARAIELPLELGAAVGLVAMFGAAANAPFALTVLAVELFGWNVLPHAFVVVFLTYAMTGRRSLYASQLR